MKKLILAVLLLCGLGAVADAGEWRQNRGQWYYHADDGVTYFYAADGYYYWDGYRWVFVPNVRVRVVPRPWYGIRPYRPWERHWYDRDWRRDRDFRDRNWRDRDGDGRSRDRDRPKTTKEKAN